MNHLIVLRIILFFLLYISNPFSLTIIFYQRRQDQASAMVYVPNGTRVGTLKVDPLDVPAPPATYCSHQLPHGSSVLIQPNAHKMVCYRVFQNQTVQNFPVKFCQTPDSYFDAQLNGSPVDALLGAYLHFQVTNSNSGVGATSVTPMLACAFFDRIEVQPNGSQTDDTIYTEQLYWDYIRWLENDSERTSRGLSVGMETKAPVSLSGVVTTQTMWDEDGTVILPGASREYLFPLVNFMTQSSIILTVKGVDPRFRVFGRVNPITSYNAVGDLAGTPLVFGQMEMILDGIKFQPAIRDKITAHYQKRSAFTRILFHERFQYSIASIATNVYLGDIQLTPFAGEYSSILWYVNRNDADRERLYYGSRVNVTPATLNPLPVGKITWNTSSGRPVYYNDHSAFLHTNVFGSTTENNTSIFQYKPYYPTNFCLKRESLRSGRNTGGLAMDSAMVFKFQLLPGFTVGATTGVQLNMLGLRYGVLEQTSDGAYIATKL